MRERKEEWRVGERREKITSASPTSLILLRQRESFENSQSFPFQTCNTLVKREEKSSIEEIKDNRI